MTDVSFTARRLSAMFTEDGDSRDSGYSDTTSSDGRQIPLSATMFPSLSDDMRDMDEVFMPEEDSNDSCCSAISMIREELVRVQTVDNNNQENTTVSRTTTEETTVVSVPRLHRSSTVKLPRKRAIHSCEDADVIDVKRVRVSVLTVIQNDTPPSRKFLKKQTTLTRINSTSILEVKAHGDENGEHIPEIVQTIYSLPIIDVKDCSMAYRRIQPETLGNLMKTLSPEDFHAQYILVDCRYPFEFSGGHIRHAVNLYEQDDCSPYFFCEEFDSRRIPIFYCEYSQKRGPSMASVLRRCDRIKNVNCYPSIKFNEIYVLDQGYKGFFEWARLNDMDSFCTPNAYVRMDDRRYKAELKAFPFHKKSSRGPLMKLNDEKKRRSPIRSRRLLFKSKTVALTPSSPIREDQDLSPCRLNFSISSPESSFL